MMIVCSEIAVSMPGLLVVLVYGREQWLSSIPPIARLDS
jgi:hypothetical protein